MQYLEHLWIGSLVLDLVSEKDNIQINRGAKIQEKKTINVTFLRKVTICNLAYRKLLEGVQNTDWVMQQETGMRGFLC